MDLSSKRIAVIGGTGKLGAALARRFAKSGLDVIVGSRSAESAIECAAGIGKGAQGMTNSDAAAAGDVVLLAIPFAAQDATAAEIAPHVAGKIVVDTSVPLKPPAVMRVQLPPEGSAAQRLQGLLGEAVTVISAFHSVAAHKLATDAVVDCDVLVFGNDKEARGAGVALADAAGLRGLHGGALANSAAAEALTSVLIFLNKTYQVDGAGIRITGALREAAA
jgi:NADPH-dependent F420 reductase